MTVRSRRRLLATLAVLVALVASPAAALLPPGLPAAAPAVAAASNGLTMNADAVYVVDPAVHRIHVKVQLTVTNHLTDTKTHRYYFDRTYLAVQPGTTGFRVASSGVKPKVAVQTKRGTYTLLQIDFGKQLAAGSSRTFNLTFDLIDPGGAATRPTRIGTSLVTFGAWGFGGAGAAGGSVTVTFPPGFTIDVQAANLGKPTTDALGNTVYATGRLDDPLTFFADFVADRPSDYVEQPLTIQVRDQATSVSLRAWPDDAAWAKRVGSLLARGLPALATAIGLPWTAAQPLVVEEAVSRSRTGFAGRYNPPAGKIEIAYYADTFVVLHEAAHAWFDGSLLADRWASEGFASWYAVQAAAAIGEKKVSSDVLTPALEQLRVPLNAWGPPGVGGVAAEEAEYAAALKLAGLVAARAGPDDLTAVWQAIHDHRGAYQPPAVGGAIEQTDAAADWRGLLDVLEDRTRKSFDDLWTAWVVRPAEASLLVDRAAARARYSDVMTRAGAWHLPRIVRDALRAWQFDQAQALFDEADRALDSRDAVAAAAAAAGLTPPDALRAAFEGPHGFAAAMAEADAELAAIAVYRDAAASRLGSPDSIEAIGLWNADPAGTLDRAAVAFAAGDLRTTVEASAFARATWQSADGVGRNRIVAVAASLGAFLLGSWLVLRWYRDRRIGRRSMMARRG